MLGDTSSLDIKEGNSLPISIEYQNLHDLEKIYDTSKEIRQTKARITELKEGFMVSFRFKTGRYDYDYIELAQYTLAKQEVKYITQWGTNIQRYGKYFSGNIKEVIEMWIIEAKLPIDEEKTMFYEE